MQTARDVVIKWTMYGAASLVLAFLYALTLRDVELFGVTMFLPPLLVAVIASLEDTRPAVVYGLVCGVLCDLTVTGTIPCVYTLAFTLASLAASLLAKSVLQPGVFRSFAVTLLTFAVLDAFNMLALLFKAHAPLVPMLVLTAREALVSCLLLAVVHPALMFLHRRFTL